jgi:heat-inducible transcriptional repressor
MAQLKSKLKTTTPASAPLSARATRVLTDVVETYGLTGEPVGSKALVEGGSYNLSGASLRNVMGDLEGLGLLMQPHTSAGRIPTAQGYRYYAQHVVETESPTAAAKQALDAHFNTAAGTNLEVLTHKLSGTISSLTNCATLITTPRAEHDPLEHLDFIRLSAGKVMVILVTKEGQLENRVIEVPEFISADDLHKAAQTLRPLIMGHTLDDARGALVAALAEQKGQVNAMIDQMMLAAAQWGQPVTADGAMVVAGSTNLFQYPELVRDQLHGLIKLFEEKRTLMALVDEVRKGPGVKIFVGADLPVPAAAEAIEGCSVVAAPYGKAGTQVLGTIGVIGPQRLNYKHTLSVVNYTQAMLNKLLAEPAAT